MIQLILTFVGLLFPTDNTSKINPIQDTITLKTVSPVDPDTGGETIPVLPPKK